MADITTTQQQFEDRCRRSISSFYENNEGVNKMMKLDFVECDAAEKRLVMRHVPGHGEANPLGTIHGGITAWLLDTAMGMVNYCYIGEGATPTVSMSINYVEAVHEGDEILLVSWIDRIGKNIVDCRAEARVDGRVKATAIGTSFRLHLPQVEEELFSDK